MDGKMVPNSSGRRLRSTRKRRARVRRRRFAFVFFTVCVVAILLLGGKSLRAILPSAGQKASPLPLHDSEGDPAASLPVPGAAAPENAQENPWFLILTNKWNPIPENYTVELTQLSNGEQVDTRIYPALQEMFDAARADGIFPVVGAGYRTAEKQQSLMDEKIEAFLGQGYAKEEAQTEAERWVAVPGTSEHQLGLAVDINADGVHSAGYEVYSWLAENAYRYGFVLRYPEDKEEITGTAYEAWHYRYVGTEAAAEIQENGWCLEEYLESKT